MLKRFLIPAAALVAAAAPVAAQQTPFGGLTPQGRAILAEAMSTKSSPATAAAIARARGRVLELLAAERLDLEAIDDAQREERRLVLQEHAQAHARMRAAYQKLSTSDRQAFANAIRLREARMRAEMAAAQNRMNELDRLMDYQMRRVAEIRARQQQQSGARTVSQDRED